MLHAGLELWSVDGATTTSPCTRVYCARRTLGVEGSGAERHGHPDDTSSRQPTSLQAGALLHGFTVYGMAYAHGTRARDTTVDTGTSTASPTAINYTIVVEHWQHTFTKAYGPAAA